MMTRFGVEARSGAACAANEMARQRKINSRFMIFLFLLSELVPAFLSAPWARDNPPCLPTPLSGLSAGWLARPGLSSPAVRQFQDVLLLCCPIQMNCARCRKAPPDCGQD